MLLTGFGAALALVALFTDTDYRWAALAAGAIQIAVGYGWIVRLTYLRDPQRGALCAVPPLTLIYLVQHKYAKLRPLRFIATGAVIVALAALTPILAPHTQSLFHKTEAEPAAQPDPTTQSKLVQLRYYSERKAYDQLMTRLDVLAKTDPLLSEDAKDRAELATELRALCQHIDTGVKVRAMSAYARWDPDGARAVCLAAVRSPSSEEPQAGAGTAAALAGLRLRPRGPVADRAPRDRGDEPGEGGAGRDRRRAGRRGRVGAVEPHGRSRSGDEVDGAVGVGEGGRCEYGGRSSHLRKGFQRPAGARPRVRRRERDRGPPSHFRPSPVTRTATVTAAADRGETSSCRSPPALYYEGVKANRPARARVVEESAGWGDSSAGRALRSQRRGREFDSPSLHFRNAYNFRHLSRSPDRAKVSGFRPLYAEFRTL